MTVSNRIRSFATDFAASTSTPSNRIRTLTEGGPSTFATSNVASISDFQVPGPAVDAGPSQEVALDAASNPPNAGPAAEQALDVLQNATNVGPAAEQALDATSNPPNAGPVQEQPGNFLPTSWTGPQQEQALASLPIPPATKFAGPAQDSLLNSLPQDEPSGGPTQEIALDAILGTSPFINDVTVVQRDAATSFLTDVAYRAGQVLGDPLTTEVEFMVGGGAWTPATAQVFDRKHDPELPENLIRPLIRQGLEAYWRFQTDFLDSGERQKPLTENGTVPFVAGLLGDAAQFTANQNNYLERASNDAALDLPGSTDFTLHTWVQWTNLTGEQVVMEKFGPAAIPEGWSLVKLADNRIQFQYNNILISTLNVLAVADATFHQIVVRRLNRVITIWYDGVEQVLSFLPPEPIPELIPSTNPFLMGRRVGVTSNPLHALVDETQIWLRGTSGAEILSLYNSGAGLVLEGTATTAPGTLFNYVWQPFFDLPEGTFTDVFIRISVSNNPTTTVTVGPFTIVTTTPTQADALAAAQRRRNIQSRTPFDFLGCGLVIPLRRGSRDLVNGCDVELIKSSVAQILGTRAAVGRSLLGDLPWRPDFGSKIWVLRHRRNDPTLEGEAQSFVLEALSWEPRVEVTQVTVEREPLANPNELRIRVKYEIISENVDDNRVVLPEFEEVVTIS